MRMMRLITLTRVHAIRNRQFSTKLINPGYNKGDDLIEVDRSIMNIRGYGERSFQVNEVYIQQSVILFNKTLLAWNARTFDDINEESLALIPLILPTPEILLIGTGIFLCSHLL
jgi:hypothetical protein